jgi:hypothetical protein
VGVKKPVWSDPFGASGSTEKRLRTSWFNSGRIRLSETLEVLHQQL